MLASLVLVASSVLVLALLGVPARRPLQARSTTLGALVAQGARTLLLLTERQHLRLGHPVAQARPATAPQRVPCQNASEG